MTSTNIRAARPADVAAITAIYREAVATGTASFELAAPDQVEMRARMEAITAAGYPYLVAEADGLVAGYAYASAYRTRPAYRFTVENSVYVAPGMQRRGIGGRLLDALIGAAAECGYRRMIAIIGDGANQSGSVALHRRAGFEPVGTLQAVGWKNGRWLDTLIMQRQLGSGASAPPQ